MIELFDGPSQTCQNPNQHLLAVKNYNPEIAEFLFQYAKENFSILKIYLREPYYTKIKKDEQISYISFTCQVGGLMGLCLGLSFVSVFEIIFHCFNFSSKKITNLITKMYFS